MSENSLEFLTQVGRLRTTPLGIDRVISNIGLKKGTNTILRARDIIGKALAISLIGKNWYVHPEDVTITINTFTYTIITAHFR